MKGWELSKEDLIYLADHGIDPEIFNRYRSLFEAGKYPPDLVRPCTLGDGIEFLGSEDQEAYIELYESEALKGRCSKFVPASGAATRMFQSLCLIFQHDSINTLKDLASKAATKPELKDTLKFFQHISKFPFFPELQSWCKSHGLSVEEILEKGPLKLITRGILRHHDGLGLGTLPKALLPFHRYGEEVLTAFDEHILEAAGYVTDENGICQIHFTVPEEHLTRFEKRAETISKRLAAQGVHLNISFSIQHPSTHTPAVNQKGELVRRHDGKILLRPGGHGALLKNLQEFGGDIVFIKNVDNVPEDHIKPLVVRWKKILGGMLIAVERDFNQALDQLEKDPDGVAKAEAVWAKWKQVLPPNYDNLNNTEKKRLFSFLLDRPKRVCGMVQNVGQPGGGPFWVKDPKGWICRQIIEKPQIDSNNPQQVAIWNASTHFNPVDVVCALKNSHGKPYQLFQFVDQTSYIITEKSHHGILTKVLEHPGLWNGSMAWWITVFVEVPRETFYPVKQITDLLEKESLKEK
ncbi:MAG: DUF4301 family protein [Thermodesulforhabdaceae bacterium]